MTGLETGSCVHVAHVSVQDELTICKLADKLSGLGWEPPPAPLGHTLLDQRNVHGNAEDGTFKRKWAQVDVTRRHYPHVLSLFASLFSFVFRWRRARDDSENEGKVKGPVFFLNFTFRFSEGRAIQCGDIQIQFLTSSPSLW